NKEEGKYLNSSKGQTEMGKAIAQAIIKYRSSIPDEETVISNGQPPVESPEVAEIPKKANPDLKQQETLEVNKEVKTAVVELAENSPSESTGKNEIPEETKDSKPKVRQLVEKSGVTFKVQIMASAKDLPSNSPEFNGLNRISKEPIKNLIRYLYGETDTYMGAKLLKSNADMKGFTTSYIVAYKEGKRIALQDALKYEDE
ncbi:MAG: hypothetical protein HKO75_10215, partial [Flavobacteriaceae bacterium]|nr:hypothetical protein [Muriicola sp.]NNL40222.1 hypothetical protein [Flavobacteriaceae bacterium]